MSFQGPRTVLQDPISGFTAAITSTGALVVNPTTINVTATSVQLTSSSVTITAGSVVVTNASVVGTVSIGAGSVTIVGGTVQVEGGASVGPLATAPVSNTSVAGTTAFVSVKVGAGRFFGLTMATSGAGVVTVTDGSAGVPIFGLASTQTAAAPEYFGCVPSGNIFTTALVVVGTASSPAVIVHFS